MHFRTFHQVVLAVFFSFSINKSEGQKFTTSKTNLNDSLELVDFAKGVLLAIKSSDYLSVSKYIHPTLGVRFSPYAFTDVKSDLKFSISRFRKAINTNEKFMWGEVDPTGDSIFLTIKGYFKKYVYDVDFLTLNIVAVNNFIGGGNTLNNLKDVYKDFDFVEFHCKGVEEKYEGMDWKSVRLIMSRYNGKLYLIGVVHDEWTI